MRDEILFRVNADLISVPPLISRMIRKKLEIKNPGEAELDLKMTHFEILRTLKEEGTMHPVEISERLFIAKARITHLIDKLVELGFVKREWGATDRRTINVILTEKGRKLLDEQDSLFFNAIKENLDSFSEADLDTLSNSLRVFRSMLLKLQ